MITAIFILIAWTICAVIAYAIVGYIAPSEVEGDEALYMCVCFVTWWLLLLVGIGYLIFSTLSKAGDWARGFLTGLLEKDGEKE